MIESTTIDRGISVFGVASVILAGCLMGSLVISSPMAAFGVAIGGLLLGLLLRKPLHIVGALIVITPFALTPFLRTNLLPLPGSKAFQLLALLVAGVALWNLSRAQRIPRYVVICTLVFAVLFTICVLRGLSNLELLLISDGKSPTPIQYLLTHWIGPPIFLLPFIIIPLYCRTIDDLETVVGFLVAATIGLTCYVLYLYGSCHGDIGAMSEVVAKQTGLHRNAVGSLLMVSFPFLIARFMLRKSALNAVAIGLSVAATCFLFSRTAYVTLALAPFLYAFASKRAKAIPILLVVVVGLVALMPFSVRERASKGIESRDVNKISAGRVDHIWLPLLEEYLADPRSLVFGRGRYAMVSSDAIRRVNMTEARHPHNLYLEMLIEMGLVGVCFTLTFLAIVFGPIVKIHGRPADVRLREYSYAVLVSAGCYFIAGITGRSVFPRVETGFFWVMMGIAVAIPLLYRGEQLERKSLPVGTVS